jgi:hypothetical protein
VVKIFVIGGLPDQASPNAPDLLSRSMQQLGADIVNRGHELVVCSPLDDTADAEALRGAASAIKAGRTDAAIEFHYPETEKVVIALDRRVAELGIQFRRHSYEVPLDAEGKMTSAYGWLLPQIWAVDSSHAAVGVGGRLGGTAGLLFSIAQTRRQILLPLTFLKGAAERAFLARQAELRAQLGEAFDVLHDPEKIVEIVPALERMGGTPAAGISINADEDRFFVSYAKARPQEADIVEMMLRRRNLKVFRDGQETGANQPVQTEIIEEIHRSSVFIILWCREYACSPWCYDELVIALERFKAEPQRLWILQVDETRMIHPAARRLVTYPTRNREELEVQIRGLLEQVKSPTGP